jgi:TolA-binding protein
MKFFKRFTFFCTIVFLLSACATTPDVTEEKKIPPEKKPPTEEEVKNAADIFNRILEVIVSTEDRQSVLPEVEGMYMEIVDNYPNLMLAEESLWRVITMNIEEYNPPRIERAEKLYHEFHKKYPGSPFNIYLEQSFGQFYYLNKIWDKLMRFFTPQIKGFIQSGKLTNPYPMFMYSEAKFNLGDLVEAEKGYKIVIEFFPHTSEGKTSKNRLREIQDKKQIPKGSSTGGT